MFGTPDAAKLDRQLAEQMERKRLYDKEREIRNLRKQMRAWDPPETSKVIMIFLIANFVVVEAYSMWIMWYLGDASALYTLITAVLGETLTYVVYAAKSYHGKKQEESVKLEREKMALEYGEGVSPEESGMDESADPEAEQNQKTEG